MRKATGKKRDQPEASAPVEVGVGSLGSIIRKARLGRKMVLQELADKADLSISFLSQVERNLLTPSVSALKRIADVLDIPAGSLMFGAESRKGGVGIGLVRRGSRKRVVFPDSQIEYEMLTPDLRRRMSALWLKAPPRSESGPVFSHDGEDAVIVLRGRLKIEIGGVWYELAKGDSLYFNSELPHRWRNDSDSIAEVVWVSTPPSF
ncbi:helix-turn-helix domain-containing protein [Reyranella massiliensis]|uniref:helix-turn-helix domain-containing protein n=1 Tax=Reyranella massiliensis TaxID=445220 RepID=UPI0011D23DDE|nr:cupin domain-containing protein [Reyranella massiliensis]